MELARGRESKLARIIDLRSINETATHGFRCGWRFVYAQSEIPSIAAAQRALEAVDGELAGHDALKVRAAHVVIQLRHFDIPMKDLADGRQVRRKCASLVRNRNIFAAVNTAHVSMIFSAPIENFGKGHGRATFASTGLSRCSLRPV